MMSIFSLDHGQLELHIPDRVSGSDLDDLNKIWNIVGCRLQRAVEEKQNDRVEIGQLLDRCDGDILGEVLLDLVAVGISKRAFLVEETGVKFHTVTGKRTYVVTGPDRSLTKTVQLEIVIKETEE